MRLKGRAVGLWRGAVVLGWDGLARLLRVCGGCHCGRSAGGTADVGCQRDGIGIVGKSVVLGAEVTVGMAADRLRAVGLVGGGVAAPVVLRVVVVVVGTVGTTGAWGAGDGVATAAGAGGQ